MLMKELQKNKKMKYWRKSKIKSMDILFPENFFLNRWIKHSGWWHDYTPKFLRKIEAR